jgi:hypothetical protein
MIVKLRNRSNSDPKPGQQPVEGASTGQVLIMFAFFIMAMIGILGLAIDLGYSFSQRRTVQNAADLAAVAGARQVARYGPQNPDASAGPDVRSIVSDNHMGNVSSLLEACSYLDHSGFPQTEDDDPAGCDGTIPSNATGVYVKVSETHSTFFMRAIPGAPVYATTRAEATAQVERLDLAGMDSPFILCGYGTKHLRSDGTVGTLSVVLSNLQGYAVNPDAIGETFQLTGTTGAHDIEKCGATGSMSSWHGLADKSANLGKRVVLSTDPTGNWWNPMIGSASVNASTVTNKVNGIDGCPELAAKPYDCVMLIPVATEYYASTKRLKVTKVMAFEVWKDGDRAGDPGYGDNVYWGKLIDDYLVFGASVPTGVDQAPWSRDSGSVVVVRLTS